MSGCKVEDGLVSGGHDWLGGCGCHLVKDVAGAKATVVEREREKRQVRVFRKGCW